MFLLVILSTHDSIKHDLGSYDYGFYNLWLLVDNLFFSQTRQYYYRHATISLLLQQFIRTYA